MEFRITFNPPMYSLQKRVNFLWFKYWSTMETSHDFNYLENKYKELTT